MTERRPIRVLIAKVGLDGHDRGAKVLVLGLRDQGMEVIYTGVRQSPEMIVKTAMEEDVDVIGLSSMVGAHNDRFPRVMELLKEKGMDDVLVIGGGIIPQEDRIFLEERGVKATFGPGTLMKDIADFIKANVKS